MCGLPRLGDLGRRQPSPPPRAPRGALGRPDLITRSWALQLLPAGVWGTGEPDRVGFERPRDLLRPRVLPAGVSARFLPALHSLQSYAGLAAARLGCRPWQVAGRAVCRGYQERGTLEANSLTSYSVPAAT